MKTFLIKLGIVLALAGTIWAMSKRIQSLNESLGIAVTNEKAYAAELSSEQEKNREFLLTATQLKQTNDSLFLKMKQTANELGIKDSKIASLQYQLKTYNNVQEIIIRDTLFTEPKFKFDTCLVTQWDRSCLSLEYPNKISLTTSYVNEEYAVWSTKKEPIKERTWFLPRWFTKKHTIVEVTVIDKNPNVQTQKQRFVTIIK